MRYFAESKDQYKNWDFSNNVYFRTEGTAIEIAGRIYDHQHLLGSSRYFYPPDKKQEIGSLTVDPAINLEKMMLEDGSPCIDAGIYVGIDFDFHGNPVPAGKTNIDIGPFEFQE